MTVITGRRDRPLEEIIRALQEGRDTRDNFKLVFERFYTPVYRVFQHKGMPPEDCSDLTQEVFLAAFKSLHDVRDPAQFPGWLFTVARNVFHGELERRYARKRGGARPTSPHPQEDGESIDLDQLPGGDPRASVLTDLLDRERIEMLKEALQRLPMQMRRCVQLRVGEDSSYEEIAAALGISINTVKVHLHRARKELKTMLGPWFEPARAGGEHGIHRETPDAYESRL